VGQLKGREAVAGDGAQPATGESTAMGRRRLIGLVGTGLASGVGLSA
jgi:hypothetical protein